MNKVLKILILSSFVYYEIVFMLLKPMDNKRLGLLSLLLSFLFGLIVCFILTKLKKGRKRFLLIIISLVSLIYIIESYLYCIFNTYYFIDTINDMVKDVVGTYVKDIIKLVFSNYIIIVMYILPIIVFALLSKKYYENQHIVVLQNKKYAKNQQSITIIVPIILICIATIIVFIVKEKELFNEYTFNSTAYKYGLNTSMLMEFLSKCKKNDYNILENEEIGDKEYNKYNVLNIDFDKIEAENNKMEIKKINEYVKNEIPTKKNDYTGIFKGKNLIMICAESFYSHAVTKDITPTLYRLMHNGFEFNDYYNSLSYISTSTGEFQFLMGLIPILGAQCMRKTVNHNNYFTIANQMKRIGYNTASFHNGKYDYYNRDITHENLGYDYFMAMGNGLEKLTTNNSDFQLFDRTIDLYKDKKPFSVYYMTYDCHMPYDIFFPEYKDNFALVNKYIGEQTMSECKMYYAKLISFDKALENLLKRLDEEKILNDTVICLTADHYPYGLEQYGKKCLYSICGYEYDDDEVDKRDKNSMILWSPMLEDDSFKLEKKVDSPTSPIDILPTLSNLFGLNYDSRFMVGRDVFSDKDPLVIWDNYSFKNEKVFYNSVTKTVDVVNGATITDEELERLKTQVFNKIHYSKDINSFDYYKYIFPDDNQYVISENIVETTNISDMKQEIIQKVKKPVTYKDIFEAIEDMDNINSVVDVGHVDDADRYSTMNFGRYEQDNNLLNGKEEIEWYIVGKSKSTMLLLSKYILDVKPYNEYGVIDSWEKSSLREFLNKEFYDEAFSADEKQIVFNMPHETSGNTYHDYVYIFDREEYNTTFGANINNKENKSVATEGTPYAKSKGLFVKEARGKWFDGNSLYWLNNVNRDNGFTETIEYNGYISGYGVDQKLGICGVRPVICLYW